MIAISSGYLYWANRGTGTIGRAGLDGTRVHQRILAIRGRPTGAAVG